MQLASETCWCNPLQVFPEALFAMLSGKDKNNQAHKLREQNCFAGLQTNTKLQTVLEAFGLDFDSCIHLFVEEHGSVQQGLHTREPVPEAAVQVVGEVHSHEDS